MQLGLGVPVWRGGAGRPAWPHPKSVWAADFKGDRYALLRRARDLSALETTTRSSAHLLADASGTYQSFAANTLARVTGVGAYIGGQVTNKCTNYNANPALTDMTKYGTGSVLSIVDDQAALVAAGLQNIVTAGKVYKLDNSAGASEGGVFFAGVPGNVNKHTTSIYMRTVGGTACVAINSSIANAFATYAAYSRVTVTGTPIDTGRGAQIKVAAGGVAYFILNQFEESPFTTPPITTAGAAATRYASAVTAASMDWFNATSLGMGASELVVPAWSHVGDAGARPLFEFSDGTSNNLIKGYIDAADKPTLQIVAGGAVQATAALTSSIALGRKPLAFGWGVAGGYVADKAGNVATFGAITMPAGLNVKRLGSSLAGNYLNDTIEQQQSCRPLTQAEAQAWVAAA